MNVRGPAGILTASLLLLAAAGRAAGAETYCVSPAGEDANPGTMERPFKTIQKGLDVVKPGDACEVSAGTYKEALVLKTTGRPDARITLRSRGEEAVTVESAKQKSLRTNGRHQYYTIEGFHFVAGEHTDYEKDFDYSLDFEDGIWDGPDKKEGGNNGFILRNCVIDGAVHFYGHDVLMENCELRGHDAWRNGVWASFMVSYGNTFRNNRISGYTIRGIWTMSNTDDVLIEGNTVFHCADIGIDLDGAGRPVRRARVIGNTVYDIYKEGSGIELEDAFASLVERNVIHDVAGEGIESINYGLTTWEGKPGGTDKEYRTTDTKTVLRNNVIYNADKGGIVGYSSPGLEIYNNTIVGGENGKGWFAGIAMTPTGKPQRFYSKNWRIRNNIIVLGKWPGVWMEAPDAGLLEGLELSNNLYWSTPKRPTHYLKVGDKTIPLEEFQKTSGQERGSIFADPMFVDAEKHDFRLREGSAAIGAGEVVDGLRDDFAGNPRPEKKPPDIGAFQFAPAGHAAAGGR